MMFPYITFADETEVTHSQTLVDGEKEYIEVHFERAIESGFQSARCRLPEYTWLYNDGFPEETIAFFDDFLMHNAHLLFRYAADGGLTCA